MVSTHNLGDNWKIEEDANGDYTVTYTPTNTVIERIDSGNQERILEVATQIGTLKDATSGATVYDSGTFGDGTQNGDLDALTVGKGFENITDSANLNLNTTAIVDDTRYNSYPRVAQLYPGTVIVIYRDSAAHTGDDSVLSIRKSTEYGRPGTYDAETTVHSDADAAVVNHTIAYAHQDTIRVLTGVNDNSTSTYEDLRLVTSTDGGETWTSQSILSSVTMTGTIYPFGDGIQTSNGLMVPLYNTDGKVEVIFSTDNGASWTSGGIIADTSGVAGRILTEPWAVSVGGAGDDLIIYGRETDSNEMFSLTSTDGGDTWSGPTYFQVGTSSGDKIPAAIMSSPDTLDVYISDRSRGVLVKRGIDPDEALSDPTVLANAPEVTIDQQTTTTGIDFGYPAVCRTGATGEGVMLAWYDDADDNTTPEIYQTSPDPEPLPDQLISESGVHDFGDVAANDFEFVDITFNRDYDTEPVVLATAGGLSGTGNPVGFAIAQIVDPNGFRLVVQNYESTSDTFDHVSWIVIPRR